MSEEQRIPETPGPATTAATSEATPPTGPQKARGERKVRTGVVVSDKMDRTVLVRIDPGSPYQLQELARYVNGEAFRSFTLEDRAAEVVLTRQALETRREELLRQLDASLARFFADLEGHPHREGVVVVASSEFGRRVAANASGGTDHGAAGPVLVAGPRVKGGTFYGDEPSLVDLDDGDLKHTTDFRSVYATVLEGIVGFDARRSLGGPYPRLDLL